MSQEIFELVKGMDFKKIETQLAFAMRTIDHGTESF